MYPWIFVMADPRTRWWSCKNFRGTVGVELAGYILTPTVMRMPPAMLAVMCMLPVMLTLGGGIGPLILIGPGLGEVGYASFKYFFNKYLRVGCEPGP